MQQNVRGPSPRPGPGHRCLRPTHSHSATPSLAIAACHPQNITALYLNIQEYEQIQQIIARACVHVCCYFTQNEICRQDFGRI